MIDRRNILRAAMFGAGAAAFPRNVMATMEGVKAAPGSDKQVLFVFLRGGNDATNTVVPFGDGDYLQARPNLGLTGTELSSIAGANYARYNSNLDRLQVLDLHGKVAWIHQVGDPAAKRSHFIAMDMFETAAEQTVSLDALQGYPGFVNKILATAGIPSADSNGMPAATSFAGRIQRMFRTDQVGSLAAHSFDLADLSLPYPVPGASLEAVLDGHAQDHIANPATPIDGLSASNLAFGLETRTALEGLGFSPGFSAANGWRFPVTDQDLATLQTVYPTSTLIPPPIGPGLAFMESAEQALYALINAPSMRVAGVDFGGWDTHGNQQQEHPDLLLYLGWGLRDLYDEMVANGVASRITIVVVSEFGRTNSENSGVSTDHGVGGAYIAIGDGVRGGTYNCHGGPGTQGFREYGAPWTGLLSPQLTFSDALNVETDFRDVLAEICSKCFGISDMDLPSVIPGYNGPITPWLDFLL